MRLLGFVLLFGVVAFFPACGGQESRLSSTGEQPPDKEAQVDQDTEDAGAIDQLKTTPDPEPEQQVDPPVAVDPPGAVDPPALDPPVVADRILDGKKAQKLEVRHSMIGLRNTLLFYTFKDQQAILTLSIGNTDVTFPVTGKKCVDLIITDLAVMRVTDEGLLLEEIAPGVTVDDVIEVTDADLVIPESVKTISIE